MTSETKLHAIVDTSKPVHHTPIHSWLNIQYSNKNIILSGEVDKAIMESSTNTGHFPRI